jgi:hypothetical protein
MRPNGRHGPSNVRSIRAQNVHKEIGTTAAMKEASNKDQIRVVCQFSLQDKTQSTPQGKKRVTILVKVNTGKIRTE